MKLESFYSDGGGIKMGRIVGLFIAFIVFVGIIMIALWAFGVFTADIKGQGDVYKETHEAGYRMEAYNHFYDQFASIKGLEGSIDATVKQLSQMQPGTKDYSRIQTNLTAQQSLRHQAIQQYNADARKGYTIGQWKAADLPYQIEDSEYPGGVQ
jgi:hypothetical protein